MFELSVTRRFEASHQLRLPDGNLEDLHTHDWRVTVAVAADELDQWGWVMDFGVLKAEIDALLAPLTGRNLGAIPTLAQPNPSAETLAACIADALTPKLPAHVRLGWVEVEEEPGCTARVYGGVEQRP